MEGCWKNSKPVQEAMPTGSLLSGVFRFTTDVSVSCFLLLFLMVPKQCHYLLRSLLLWRKALGKWPPPPGSGL